MIRRRRASLTLVLTAAVLVLLPVLAHLQYHWLSQIGEDTGNRMRAVAASAAESLSADLAFEAARSWRERTQPMSGTTQVGDTAQQGGLAHPLVVDALIVDRLDRNAEHPRVRRWDLDSHSCEPADWPAGYGPLPAEGRRLADQLQRRSTSLAVVPIDLPADARPSSDVRPACELTGNAIVAFRLDAAMLRRGLLPEVARRHVDALEDDDFFVAVVSHNPALDVIYVSPGADAAALAARPDVALPLTLARIDHGGRGGGRGRGGREGPLVSTADLRGRGTRGRPSRSEPGDGWLFVAQHRAGSLESAVTRLRQRNLAVSLGILSLLGVAVALIAANARKAERLARQQVEFVAAVSHEMRTPVTGIEVAARNLEDGLVVDPVRVRRYGSVIGGEARRLAETVERVLRFAALEAGRSIGPAVEVDAQHVIEEVVARFRTEHPEATIELDPAEGPLLVRSDAGILRSAVSNLLANAVKYGGTPAWAGVRISRGDSAAELLVTVEDHGPGIDPRDVSHVFEPFYRGTLATERQAPGNGLGLHIVKRSIEALGGRVSLRTGIGSGTAVTLHLPLSTTAEQDNGEPATPAAGRG